jgi:hypothetical protein
MVNRPQLLRTKEFVRELLLSVAQGKASDHQVSPTAVVALDPVAAAARFPRITEHFVKLFVLTEVPINVPFNPSFVL